MKSRSSTSSSRAPLLSLALALLVGGAGCGKKKSGHDVAPPEVVTGPTADAGGAPVATVDAGPKVDWEAAFAAATKNPPKDLQVLPAAWTGQQVVDYMKTVGPALGVKCGFCHPNAVFDTDNKHKLRAREMISMTNEINKAIFHGKPDKDEVTCNTCHRGAKEPTEPPHEHQGHRGDGGPEPAPDAPPPTTP